MAKPAKDSNGSDKNNALRDAQIRHKVGIQRAGSQIVKDVIPILDQGDKDIVDLLNQRTPTLEGNFDSARRVNLLKQVRQINNDSYQEFADELSNQLDDLGDYEMDFQSNLYEDTEDDTADIPDDYKQAIYATPFFGYLLKDALTYQKDQKYRLIQQTIQRGIAAGDSADDIITELEGTALANYRDGAFATARRGVEGLVRTAVNHTASIISSLFFGENYDAWQWVATLDTDTCIECADLDGEIYMNDEDAERPPLHLNCRCTPVPVDSASAAGDTDGFSGWLGGQSAEVQDEALGPTRGKLFRDGGLTIDRFVDVRGNELTLDQLRKREASAFRLAGLDEGD